MQHTVTKVLNYQVFIARSMALLAALCALCAFLYGVFLLEAVAHAAARTEAQRQIEGIQAQLSTLESQYLTLTEDLSPEQAQALGYVAPQSVTTVYAAVAPQLSLAAVSALK